MTSDASMALPGSLTPPTRPVRNGEAVALADIPLVSMDAFRQAVLAACSAQARLAAMTVLPGLAPGRILFAVLADDKSQRLGLLGTAVPLDNRYPALTPDLVQAQGFEREILEEQGIVPDGHPWPKPLRRHAELEGRAGAPLSADPYPFLRAEGLGIHEVAVGPVHAGIIEPGHFRFQCHGETVLHLEIQLGYQRRDAEALADTARRMHEFIAMLAPFKTRIASARTRTMESSDSTNGAWTVAPTMFNTAVLSTARVAQNEVSMPGSPASHGHCVPVRVMRPLCKR